VNTARRFGHSLGLAFILKLQFLRVDHARGNTLGFLFEGIARFADVERCREVHLEGCEPVPRDIRSGRQRGIGRLLSLERTRSNGRVVSSFSESLAHRLVPYAAMSRRVGNDAIRVGTRQGGRCFDRDIVMTVVGQLNINRRRKSSLLFSVC